MGTLLHRIFILKFTPKMTWCKEFLANLKTHFKQSLNQILTDCERSLTIFCHFKMKICKILDYKHISTIVVADLGNFVQIIHLKFSVINSLSENSSVWPLDFITCCATKNAIVTKSRFNFTNARKVQKNGLVKRITSPEIFISIR